MYIFVVVVVDYWKCGLAELTGQAKRPEEANEGEGDNQDGEARGGEERHLGGGSSVASCTDTDGCVMTME